MLASIFEVDINGMGLGIANILHRVRSRLTPNSLSGSGCSLFGSAGLVAPVTVRVYFPRPRASAD
jgi:hypothetical protein